MTNVIIVLQGSHWGWFAHSHPLIGFHSDLGGRPSGPPCPPTSSREGCPASSPSGDRHSSTKVQGQGWHPAKVILAQGPEKYQVMTIPLMSMVSQMQHGWKHPYSRKWRPVLGEEAGLSVVLSVSVVCPVIFPLLQPALVLSFLAW